MAQIDTTELRSWQNSVRDVQENVRQWAKQQGWTVIEETATISEDKLGTYPVQVVTVDTGDGRLIVEPIARWSAPGQGRIDIYGWPSLNRMMLVQDETAGWALYTEGGVKWPQAWGSAAFDYLAKNLNAAA
jgi:hypothetical protein